MTDSTLWWILTGAAVGLEMLSGTFYLLMLAIGLAAAALAAHAGAGMTVQTVVAAAVGAGAVLAWHLTRQGKEKASALGTNRDVNLDVGEVVQVQTWNPDHGTYVKYRGAQWRAVAAAGQPAVPGRYRIVQVDGNQLVLEKVDS